MEIVCHTQINELMHDRFNFHKSLSLYNICPENFQVNNQTILHFVNLWSNKFPVNISYPITVNKIDGYIDERISPTSLRYIISRDNKLNNKNKKIKIS